MKTKSLSFIIPPEGVLTPNDKYDPLPSYYQHGIRYFYRKRVKQALSLLTPPYGSTLEIGYGSGILMPTLCSISDEVIGIDKLSNPEEVSINLKKLNCRPGLYKISANEINFPAHKFNLIISISTLEHIPLDKIEILLEKIYKILAPEGHFVVGMPRINKFMEKMLSLIGYPEMSKHHITSSIEFRHLAEKYFKLKKCRHIPSFLPGAFNIYYNMLFVK